MTICVNLQNALCKRFFIVECRKPHHHHHRQVSKNLNGRRFTNMETFEKKKFRVCLSSHSIASIFKMQKHSAKHTETGVYSRAKHSQHIQNIYMKILLLFTHETQLEISRVSPQISHSIEVN